eukprot:gnl/MRDRNA2_/MRDRNA2_210155_c0_seq1.p1 gnl/MRDRNA2_/MRDRNA2_210155_c0~~gnl/MRDRNA2_/MRDRNA2_210155_c0_seq1.p1  ORF type:complete len:406 (+),score=41.48 gnl/MRDRNA2_/MRDRNA2_210155_c0_seq1:25-1218(+)
MHGDGRQKTHNFTHLGEASFTTSTLNCILKEGMCRICGQSDDDHLLKRRGYLLNTLVWVVRKDPELRRTKHGDNWFSAVLEDCSRAQTVRAVFFVPGTGFFEHLVVGNPYRISGGQIKKADPKYTASSTEIIFSSKCRFDMYEPEDALSWDFRPLKDLHIHSALDFCPMDCPHQCGKEGRTLREQGCRRTAYALRGVVLDVGILEDHLIPNFDEWTKDGPVKEPMKSRRMFFVSEHGETMGLRAWQKAAVECFLRNGDVVCITQVKVRTCNGEHYDLGGENNTAVVRVEKALALRKFPGLANACKRAEEWQGLDPSVRHHRMYTETSTWEFDKGGRNILFPDFPLEYWPNQERSEVRIEQQWVCQDVTSFLEHKRCWRHTDIPKGHSISLWKRRRLQ